MLNRRSVTLLSATLFVSSFAFAKTDYETIKEMREENAHMVNMIDKYLHDRASIPADYQPASDKEFLKKARLERWTPHPSPTPTPKAASKSMPSTASKPITGSTAKTGSKPAVKSTPMPTPSKPKPIGREY